MAKPKVSGLGNSKGLKRVPLVEGDYLLECLEAEWTESRSGNPMLVLQHQVLDGDAQENGDSPNGRKLTNRMAVTEHQFTIDKLRNAVDAHDVAVTKGDTFDEKEFVGKQAEARVTVETYEAEDGSQRETNRIQYYYVE
jgi:hypothetical protein